MRNFIARNVQRAVEWYVGAQQRARRRRSLWNLILLPLGLVAVGVTWYGLFRVVWAFHLLFCPQGNLRARSKINLKFPYDSFGFGDCVQKVSQ